MEKTLSSNALYLYSDLLNLGPTGKKKPNTTAEHFTEARMRKQTGINYEGKLKSTGDKVNKAASTFGVRHDPVVLQARLPAAQGSVNQGGEHRSGGQRQLQQTQTTNEKGRESRGRLDSVARKIGADMLYTPFAVSLDMLAPDVPTIPLTLLGVSAGLNCCTEILRKGSTIWKTIGNWERHNAKRSRFARTAVDGLTPLSIKDGCCLADTVKRALLKNGTYGPRQQARLAMEISKRVPV